MFRTTVQEADVHVTTNSGLTGPECAVATARDGRLQAPCVPAAQASALPNTVTALPHGTLTVNGQPVTATGATFSQADLDAGRVTYTPNGSDSNDSFGRSEERRVGD